MRASTLLRAVLPLATFGLLVAGTGSGAVAAGAPLTCHLVKQDLVDPGLTIDGAEGGTGTFYTPTPGNLTCEGSIDGRKVLTDELGRYLEQGRFGVKDPDTCLAGEGEGIFGAIIPTERGSARVSKKFTYTIGDLPLHGGVIAGRFQGDGFSGTLDIIPLDGDCVFEPVTSIYTINDFVFSGVDADWSFTEGR